MRKLLVVSSIVVSSIAVLGGIGGFGLTEAQAVQPVAQTQNGATNGGSSSAEQAWFAHAIGNILAEPDSSADQGARPNGSSLRR